MLPNIMDNQTRNIVRDGLRQRKTTAKKLNIPCFPENKTGLILIFTPKYGTRAYFRGMYYFDISKNEVTK